MCGNLFLCVGTVPTHCSQKRHEVLYTIQLTLQSEEAQGYTIRSETNSALVYVGELFVQTTVHTKLVRLQTPWDLHLVVLCVALTQLQRVVCQEPH